MRRRPFLDCSIWSPNVDCAWWGWISGSKERRDLYRRLQKVQDLIYNSTASLAVKSNKSFTSQSCTIYRQSGGVCVKMQVFKQESMLRLEDMFSNMFGFRPKTDFGQFACNLYSWDCFSIDSSIILYFLGWFSVIQKLFLGSLPASQPASSSQLVFSRRRRLPATIFQSVHTREALLIDCSFYIPANVVKTIYFYFVGGIYGTYDWNSELWKKKHNMNPIFVRVRLLYVPTSLSCWQIWQAAKKTWMILKYKLLMRTNFEQMSLENWPYILLW